MTREMETCGNAAGDREARIARLIRAINANMGQDGTAGDPAKLVEILRGEIEGTDLTDSIESEWRLRLDVMKEERDRLRARAVEWMPIESAPKDGRRILAFADGRARIVSWDDDRFAKRPKPYWAHENGLGIMWSRERQPTHWMPLPGDP